MAINVPGTIAVVIFYIAILVTGIIAGRKTSKSQTNESVIVADRSLGFFVSFFTITATLIGGAFINGTAESVALGGLLQAQAPVGFCLSLFLAAFAFLPPMRRAGYMTMIDPFQLKYGRKVGALMAIPQIIGDLFWSAAIFHALGATISIILDIDPTVSIVTSAAVACIYTYFGGLYSVVYTDVIQLFFIVIGLAVAFPFALNSPAVDLSKVSASWIGTVPTQSIGTYIDVYLMCALGGVAWQAYYQRVLACRNIRIGKLATVCSSLFSLVLTVPPVAVGIAGKAADWNQTSYEGPLPLPESMNGFIMPLALTYLTPVAVAVIGVGAISAAVMSSADSCILGIASVLTKNIYQDALKPKASPCELRWVMRISIILTTLVSTLIAIFSKTVYGLFVLSADLLYVIIFPQLAAVLWLPCCNAYGSLAGYFVALCLRMLTGESLLGIPAVIRYPQYDEETEMQNFPHRTFAMLVGALTLVLVSMATNAIFQYELLPVRLDVLKCTANRSVEVREKNQKLKRPHPEDDETEIGLTT